MRGSTDEEASLFPSMSLKITMKRNGICDAKGFLQ